MTVTISTDQETDRLVSLRVSSQVPLPREIALCGPSDARRYFSRLAFYEAYGLSEHPLVELLNRRTLDAAMASAISNASHADRVAHYSAWLGRDAVKIVCLQRPSRDDPDGRATGGRTPEGGDHRTR